MSVTATRVHAPDTASTPRARAEPGSASYGRLLVDVRRDDLAAVRLLLLTGGLTEAQKEALSTNADQVHADQVAGSGILKQRLAAVRKVVGEIRLEDLVSQFKGLRGGEAERFRSEAEAFRACQRMAAENGKHLSLVKFLVMQQQATLAEIDGALVSSGSVSKALEYMGEAAPPREGAQTSITAALTRDELVARRDASALALRAIAQPQNVRRDLSGVRKKINRSVLSMAAGGAVVAALCLGVFLHVHNRGARVIRQAVYQNIDFSDFASERNRRQHLVNLAGLRRIMDECSKYGDREGVERSRKTIAQYVEIVCDRDPKFAAEKPDLFSTVVAYGEEVRADVK